MNIEQISELLIRLDERTRSIEDKVDSLIDHADNGGWRRCVRQDDRITAIETLKDDKKKGELWFKRTTVGGLLGLILSKVYEYFPF